MSDAAPENEARPALRVVRGTPDDVELAALVAVLAARGGAAPGDPPARQAGGWSDRSRTLRTPLRSAPGAWRGGLARR